MTTVRGSMDDPCQHCDEMTRQRDHYRAEAERLRALSQAAAKAWQTWCYHWPDYGGKPKYPTPPSLTALEAAMSALRDEDE